MTWTLVDAPRASSLDEPTAWAYRGCADVEHEAALADLGSADAVPSALDLLVMTDDQRHVRRRSVVAVEDTGAGPRVVGLASVAADLDDNLDAADVRVVVRPGHRCRGIGAALLGRVIEIARAEGRGLLLAEVDVAVEPDAGDPDALEAPTGNGRVAASTPGVAFALAAGFDFVLVARKSLLSLPADDDVVGPLEAAARAAAGPDYRLHTWRDDLPERWHAAYADLEHQLTVDEPNPGLDIEPEQWDAARVRRTLDQLARRRQGFVITGAEHVPTGRLVAMTAILHGLDTPEYSEQETTVVMPEHRGRRLGMLLKAVNLRAHDAAWPGVRRLWTWNNEDNPHMLAINVAMGFRPAGGAALLQARTDDVRPPGA